MPSDQARSGADSGRVENRTERAEQDGEYLHGAHVAIAAALERVIEPEQDAHDLATWVLDALADAGWHLLTYQDAEAMLNAYVSQAVR